MAEEEPKQLPGKDPIPNIKPDPKKKEELPWAEKIDTPPTTLDDKSGETIQL
ncbi:MAG: hypothetical protein HY046_04700 [Acidobacteria bacterium]|nr:hypothetical protein [Acidobacteriota bacterium]